MAQRKPLDLERETIEAFDHALRVTEVLVAAVPEELWRAPPPQKGRTVAAIFAHVHGLRRTFARMAGLDVGPSLPGKTVTREEAATALRRSREALTALFAEAVAGRRGRVPGMPRRTVEMMAYLVQHDAHHRGQVTRQLSELGHVLATEETTRLWGWRKLDPEPREG